MGLRLHQSFESGPNVGVIELLVLIGPTDRTRILNLQYRFISQQNDERRT